MPARVSPTDRVRAKIDELFASERELPENLPAPNTPIPAVICPNVRREMPVIGPEYHVMMFVDYAF